MKNIAQDLIEATKNLNEVEVLKYFFEKYGNKMALSSSFGAEDQVITDMLLKISKDVRIFTLDTGRLHPQTYSVMDNTNLKYGIKVDVLFPKNEDVEKIYATQGINGFYESIENRKACCYARKIAPLKRALSTLDIWVTGLRAAQSVTREETPMIEYDEGNNVIKLNPLINWSEDDVWAYIKENNVPYNKLHDEGYPSIGCAPCTRPIEKGADIRSGRWWWENPEHKECGLHIK